jgi:hypothetical protein
MVNELCDKKQRNILLKGGIEVTVRTGRRRRKLLDDIKERIQIALCGELAFEEVLDLS